MDWMKNIEEKFKEEKGEYFKDIDICISLLKNLKEDFTTPGSRTQINSSKVTRTRLIIHDLLKKY